MVTTESVSLPLFESSLRVVLHEAFSSRVKRYDSGWRVLPFAMIAEFQQGAVQCERAGQASQTIDAGGAVVIPAGTAHRFIYPEGETTYTRYAHLRFLLAEAIDLLTLLELPPIISAPSSTQIGEICEELARMSGSLAATFSLPVLAERKALEMRLLAEIVTIAPLKPASYSFLNQVQRMAPILSYIETNLSAPLRRDDLAAIANYSPRYFDAVFKQAMDVTPQEYIKRLRMRRAQELLLQTNEAVAAIAARVGYRDAFHFTRQFHAVCGVSPRQYRNRVRMSLKDEG